MFPWSAAPLVSELWLDSAGIAGVGTLTDVFLGGLAALQVQIGLEHFVQPWVPGLQQHARNTAKAMLCMENGTAAK